ncbi:MAG: hypothetical protein ABIA04_00140 [Pseudomonadota bacterium]
MKTLINHTLLTILFSLVISFIISCGTEASNIKDTGLENQEDLALLVEDSEQALIDKVESDDEEALNQISENQDPSEIAVEQDTEASINEPPLAEPENIVIIIDSDSDGISDEHEALLGTNPFSADSDYDGLEDFYELSILHTDPLSQDTDLDGILDADDVNPLSNDVPITLSICKSDQDLWGPSDTLDGNTASRISFKAVEGFTYYLIEVEKTRISGLGKYEYLLIDLSKTESFNIRYANSETQITEETGFLAVFKYSSRQAFTEINGDYISHYIDNYTFDSYDYSSAIDNHLNIKISAYDINTDTRQAWSIEHLLNISPANSIDCLD